MTAIDGLMTTSDWLKEVRQGRFVPTSADGKLFPYGGDRLLPDRWFPRHAAQRNREASNARKGRMLSLLSRRSQVLGIEPRLGRVTIGSKTITFVVAPFGNGAFLVS